MLKKSLIFGSAALLLTALIALTGCSQATDGETTVKMENYIYGKGVTASSAQRAIEKARADNREIILADGLELSDGGAVIDFKDARVKIEGKVTVTGTGADTPLIVNTGHANVTYVDGALVVVNNFGYFIYNGKGEDVHSASPEGIRVEFTTDPMITMGTATNIAVDNYEIGGEFGNIKSEVTTIFVLDTLTITGASKRPPQNRIFRALGKVDLQADNAAVFRALIAGETKETFLFDPGSTLINTKGPVTATFEGNRLVRNVEPTGTLTIRMIDGGVGPIQAALRIENIKAPNLVLDLPDGATPVTIGNIEAAGLVQIPPTSGQIKITGNQGKVEITGATATNPVQVGTNTGEITFLSVLSSLGHELITTGDNDGTITFAENVTTGASFNGITGGTGKVVFNGFFNVGATHAVNIGTDVVFVNGLVRADSAAAGVIFGGNVDLAYGKSLDFGNTSTATSLTLAQDKVISVAGVPVLGSRADEDLVIAISTSANFTLANPAANPDDEVPVQEAAKKTLIINANVGDSGTTLRVLPNAILKIATTKTLTVGGSNLDVLVLEDGAQLTFDGTGKFSITDTVIEGAGGVLTAQGGAVTFTPNTIIGRGAAKLLPWDGVNEDTPVTITVGTTNSQTLTLKSVDLDLQTVGSLVIAAQNTGPTSGNENRVTLAAGATTQPGKITFSPGEGSALTTFSDDFGIGAENNLDQKPVNGIIKTADGTDATELISVSGGKKTNLTIFGHNSTSDTLTLNTDTELQGIE